MVIVRKAWISAIAAPPAAAARIAIVRTTSVLPSTRWLAQKPTCGTEQHHPLDAEIEHARPLREQFAERRVEERRPVEDRLGQDDDEEAVVHAAASGAVPPSACLTRRRMLSR
jgi:hypothetical protein